MGQPDTQQMPLTSLDEVYERYGGSGPLHITQADWDDVVRIGREAGVPRPPSGEVLLLGRPVVITDKTYTNFDVAEAAREFLAACAENESAESCDWERCLARRDLAFRNLKLAAGMLEPDEGD